MTARTLKFVVAFGAAMLGSSFAAFCEDGNQAALLKAISGAKISLEQGIAQVAKGPEVPTEAKYEMEDGKLMLSVYTSAKGFSTARTIRSSSIPEMQARQAGLEKGGIRDFKHIARSAQYHSLRHDQADDPAIIQKASAQGTVFSVKEKVRNGKPFSKS